MTAVKLFKIRRGERTFRRLDEGNAIALEATIDDRIIIGFSGVFSGDVVINGDLTVNGDTTTINSTTHDINDNVIVLNDGEPGAGVVTLGDISGIEIDRGTLNNNVRWVWYEPGDLFRPEFAAGGATHVGMVLDPTSGIHVGDQDFNDARYLLETNNLNDLVNPSTARTNLGVEIGVDVQAWDADLDTIAALSDADSNFIVGSGAGWVVETGPAVRVSLGLEIGVNVQAWSAVLDATTASFLIADETKLDGIETGATADQTAGEILIALLTVDGSGSLLDADFLDGLDSTAFLQNVIEDATPQLGGNLDVNGKGISFGGPQLVLAFASGGEGAVNNLEIVHANTGLGPIVRSVGADTNVDLNLTAKGTGTVNITGAVTVTSTVDGRNVSVDGTKLDGIATGADVSPVTSVFGRVGVVAAATSDYDDVQVDNTSSVTGATVKDALDTLDTDLAVVEGLHYLGAFVVASLPSAAANTNRLALATDAAVARTLVISNGSDWHIFALEGAIVTT